MSPTVDRKDQHLDVVLSGGGRHALTTGLERVRFMHEALPCWSASTGCPKA